MEIIKNINDNKGVIQVLGRVDTITAPEFDKEVKEIIDDIKELCLDFNELEYISSAGLRVLVSVQKLMNKKGGELVVKNVKEEVMEIFEVTGFDDILTIE